MAYTINGKIYTDHPLMDEIVYNCKLILKDIAIKNDELANMNETTNSVYNAEMYIIIKEGRMTFSLCPFTTESLLAYGYDAVKTRSYMIDRDNIPLEDRESLVEFTSKYFIDHFEEENNYYRTLMGLPPFATNEYDIYIDNSYIPSNYDKAVDFSIPIHKMDNSIITILQITGKIDKLLETHKGSNYSYLRFLGNKKLDIYNIRKASKWDILYIPKVESLVEDRFKELYNLNRDIYLKRTYQEAYAFSSDYYEQFMILLVICQTFTDMIVDVPEWYIRRDIFDIRSVQYFLDAYGVSFFKEIPLKYQIRIVKNLNKLIKYKSSNKNNLDILDIFSLKNTSIYKYYLYKKRIKSGDKYVEGKTDSEKYDLEFVQSKLGDTYDNYIKDQIYRTPYDDITYQDKYWDGEDTHQYIKDLHINRDFTLEGTKYMSIEYKISMSEYLYQMQYFLGLLLDSTIDFDDIKIVIPSIQQAAEFRLTDLFILLVLLTLGYDDASTDIIRPKDNTYKNKPEFTKYRDFDGGYPNTSENSYDKVYSANGGNGKLIDSIWYLNADAGDNVEYSEVRSVEDYYDWMKKYYPELFINYKNRVYGFNPVVDLTKVSEIISRRHSKFQFNNGFTLDDMGVSSYYMPTKVNSIDELISVYKNNTECYNNLKKKMMENSDNRDEYITMKFVFDSLFTKEFDYNFYTSGNKKFNKLEELLKDKDYILYTLYTKLVSEKNLEARRDNIRDIMNDIVNTLEYYLNDDSLEYIFALATVTSFSSLVHYIYLMINFFKSYKVYFLDPFVTFVADDRIENSAEAHDAIAEKKIDYWKTDKQFQRDNIFHNNSFYFQEDPEHLRIKEYLDIYGHFEPDPDDDYDYNGKYANTNETFKDANGGKASDKSCIPYIMLNAGKAQGSRRNLWDVNGAGALEMQDYLDIDGGYTFHKDDLRKDYFGTAFNYIIDGGGSSTNSFFTKYMFTRVYDDQIESSVRISTGKYNVVKSLDDGLYLGQEWASENDFDDFANDAESTYNYFSDKYNSLSEIMEIVSDETILNNKINNYIDNYLSTSREVIDYIDSSTLEDRINNYTDENVEKLYTEFYKLFNFSPFDWENF